VTTNETTNGPTSAVSHHVTTINAANYAAGIIGAAALRTMFRDPASAVPRFAELADLITKDALGLATLAIGIRPTDLAEGYGEWAQFYDQPNPAIAMEEPHVHRIVSELPRNEGIPTGPGALRLAATTLGTPFIIVWHLPKASDTASDSYFVTGKYDDRRSYGVARR
jgi:hypothetical protein